MLNALKRLVKILLVTALAVVILFTLMLLVYRWVPVPSSAFIARQNLLAEQEPRVYAPAKYQWVDWENISPDLALAVITAEDQRFPDHFGVDMVEIRKAFKEAKAGNRAPRGASTITQQVAKNLFLWHGRSYTRKLLEASISVLIELVWPKQRILEVYLNVAQFGDAVFGAQMASQTHFLVDAKDLTQEQAIFLAAILPTPAISKADKPSEGLLKRQAWIRQQMEQLGGLHYLKTLE